MLLCRGEIFFMKELSFADIFDIDMPSEKKTDTKSDKKKAASKEKKSKATGSKKQEKVIFDLPATVNTEIGEIVIDGIGTIAKDELEGKMPVPMNIVKKDDTLIGIYKTSELGKDEDENKKLFVPYYHDKSYAVVDEDNVTTSDMKKAFAIGDYKIFRYPDDMAANWNLKVPVKSKIGFEGAQCELALETESDEINIKELVDEWLKRNDWVKTVDFMYVFEPRRDGCYITFQLINKKIEEKNKIVRVKLPVKMNFLHDPGPLKVLTPEMFDGKEYVTEKDIFNIVDRYFPNIYTYDNVDISYIDSVNAVTFLKLGRKKGSTDKEFDLETSVANFSISDGILRYEHNIPLIPSKIMLEIYDYFVSNLPYEALARIMYDVKQQKYFVKYMEFADTSLTRVSWSDDVVQEDEYVVMEIHSHNSMPAFFSEVDNHDEVLPMLYGVMGYLDTKYPTFKIRAGYGGVFCNMAYWDVFAMPRIINNEFITLGRIGENALLLNIEDNNFTVVRGIKMAPDGKVSWEYCTYLGTDLLQINFDEAKRELCKKI